MAQVMSIKVTRHRHTTSPSSAPCAAIPNVSHLLCLVYIFHYWINNMTSGVEVKTHPPTHV